MCGKTSKRIKQAAKGDDGKKSNSDTVSFPKSTNKKRAFVTYNGTGNASVKGKREDSEGGDAKRQKPAFTSRKNDSESELNTKNANKRINLKVRNSMCAIE